MLIARVSGSEGRGAASDFDGGGLVQLWTLLTVRFKNWCKYSVLMIFLMKLGSNR